jgi:hypothetical protein
MDPLTSSSGLGRHSKWRSVGFLKVCLRPLRKLVRRRRNAKLATSTVRLGEEAKKDGSKFILGNEPSTVLDEEISVQRPPVIARAHLRKNQQRHDSQQSQLAAIPETEITYEEFDPLSLPQTSPLRATLLGIPPELRNQIYEHVFGTWRSPNPLAFLQTCRQIHAEAGNLAFSMTLFRMHTEHWADHDFFQARYVSQLSKSRLSSVSHLALRLPRGAPYDCYNSRRLHVDLPALGFKLKTLVLFSHYPRPLPRISDYGGVTEMDLCHWISDTLYKMPSLTELRILNYESPSPGLFDIPSPRLVRLLRGQIFRDVMTERQSLSEQEFQWHCRCEQDRSYGVYSAKLGRMVNIQFETVERMEDYGLGHIYEMRLHLNPDEMLRAAPPDLSPGAYAGLLAAKGNGSRKRLSKTLSMRQSIMRQNAMTRSGSSTSSGQINDLREAQTTNRAFAFASGADAAPKRKRLSKRYSLQSTLQSNTTRQPSQHSIEEEQRQIRHRQSWHAGGSAVATTTE